MRQAEWLDGGRARAWLVILALVQAVVAIGYVVLSWRGLDPLGKPLGTDFASFWTASQLALTGDPALVWNLPTHLAAQSDKFGAGAGYAAFFYPPPYLLICLPLALVPYAVSLALWLGVTGTAWAKMVRAWLGQDAGWLPILAFPAVLVNAGHGQNGFLTAALFGMAAFTHQRRPWLAGALFGALVFKPHLAVLVPLFLIFTGNWRAFLAAGISAVAICLISLAAFGLPAWLGFLDGSAMARLALDQNLVGYAKMQSVFGAVRLIGAGVALAWTAQILSGLAAIAGLWRVRKASPLAQGAALALATLMTTPFLFDYDLTLLAVPLAWLYVQARRRGFGAGEKLVLTAGFLLPLVSRPLAMIIGVPIAPLVIAGVFACLLARLGLLPHRVRPRSAPLSVRSA